MTNTDNTILADLVARVEQLEQKQASVTERELLHENESLRARVAQLETELAASPSSRPDGWGPRGGARPPTEPRNPLGSKAKVVDGPISR